ncbi:MAG: hypothetical protein JRI66_12035 [Deltaproteobacteria bacterium]|nr:hypothetical protein [Deltaproteobacteria bacterium]
MLEVDLSKPRREIEASFRALVHEERMMIQLVGKIKRTASYQSVPPVEPRDRGSVCIYPEMEVFNLVEREIQNNPSKSVTKVLTGLAIQELKKEGVDESHSEFDDLLKRKRKALKNAYKRDEKLYFGDY